MCGSLLEANTPRGFGDVVCRSATERFMGWTRICRSGFGGLDVLAQPKRREGAADDIFGGKNADSLYPLGNFTQAYALRLCLS
jgi:hypothetical protein